MNVILDLKNNKINFNFFRISRLPRFWCQSKIHRGNFEKHSNGGIKSVNCCLDGRNQAKLLENYECGNRRLQPIDVFGVFSLSVFQCEVKKNDGRRDSNQCNAASSYNRSWILYPRIVDTANNFLLISANQDSSASACQSGDDNFLQNTPSCCSG